MPIGLAATMVSGLPKSPQTFAAPKRFRSGEGVRTAWPCGLGPFGRTPTRLSGTAAQKAGKRYERKVLSMLGKTFGSGLLPQPWFRFEDENGKLRYCQPDAIYMSENFSAVFEVKIRLVEDAWWQLRKLYAPVVKKAYKVYNLNLFVICKYVDPAVPFPEDYNSVSSLTALKPDGWDCARINMLQWTP